MFVRLLLCRFALYFGGQKDICVKKKYCSSTMVKSAPLPTEDTSAAEAVACGFGAVHGDEIEIAADVYEHV